MDEAPRLGSLHQGFVVQEILWCLGRAVGRDVSGAGHELAADRADAPCHQTRVRETADAHARVEPFADQVEKAVAVGGMHVQQRMAVRELGEHRREMRGPERQWGGDAQEPEHVTLGRNRVLRRVEFGDNPHGMLAKGGTSLRERCASCGA